MTTTQTAHELYRDSNPHRSPQTTEYQAEFVFGNREFGVGIMHIEYRKYHSLEGLTRDAYAERHRRAKADRVTSIRYKNVLTDLGREVYRERFGNLSNMSERLGITVDEWMNL